MLAEQLGGKRSMTSCCEVDVEQDVPYLELVSPLDAAVVLARTQAYWARAKETKLVMIS